MSYGSHTRNPHESTEQDEDDNPVTCHFCGDYLGQYETMTPADGVVFNGHWYCFPHGQELQRLAQSPDPVNEIRR